MPVIQAGIDSQPVEPGAERGASLESSGIAPDLEKYFLDEFFAVLAVATVTVGQAEDLVLVAPHQISERILVTVCRQDKQFLIGLFRGHYFCSITGQITQKTSVFYFIFFRQPKPEHLAFYSYPELYMDR